jgi:DNA-binding response OmpR family regulator
MPLHVLLVDDNADDCAVLCLLLRASIPRFQPLEVRVARTWQAAKIRIVMDALDVLVLDHRVSDASAFRMLMTLRGLPHPPVVVLTPQDELNGAVGLLRAGAHEYVMKHTNEWDVELRIAIERVVRRSRLQQPLEDATGTLRDYAANLATVMAHQRAPWAGDAFQSGIARVTTTGRGRLGIASRPAATGQTCSAAE